MFGTGNGSKDEYKFKKLWGSHNYKQWTRDKSFAFEKVRLWRHVEGIAVAPPLLKPKEDDSEDRIEKIFAREEKICEFEDNARITVAKIKICEFEDNVRITVSKIGKMCTDTVQKEFFLVKTSKQWTPKDLWKHLNTRYTMPMQIEHTRQATQSLACWLQESLGIHDKNPGA